MGLDCPLAAYTGLTRPRGGCTNEPLLHVHNSSCDRTRAYRLVSTTTKLPVTPPSNTASDLAVLVMHTVR